MSDSHATLDVTAEEPSAATQTVRRFPISKELHWIMLMLSVAVLTMAALLSVDGETRVDLPFIGSALPTLCHMKRFTGMDCPGCGLTRCFVSLAHGDVAQAWHFNPAGIMVFALVAAQIPYRTIQLWRIRRGLPELDVYRLSNMFIALMVSALVLQWVWKLLQLATTWNA